MNMALLSMLITLAFSACEKINKAAEETQTEHAGFTTDLTTTHIKSENAAPATAETTLQQELQSDAQLARTLPLVKYAAYMQSRQEYYSQFKQVKYEDEFVEIEMIDGELKVETKDGSASLEE